MPLWYPQPVHVVIVRRLLAARFFPEYEGTSPSVLFGQLAGNEGRASLESALNLPRQPYYRGVHNKAGALLRSMVKNHPFVDGNKRIALVITFVFLVSNEHLLLATNREMVAFAVEIAESTPAIGWENVADWIRDRCTPISTDPVKLARALRKIQDRPIKPMIDREQRLIDELTKLIDAAEQLGS